MQIDLTNTTSASVLRTLQQIKESSGANTGMVFTLIIDCFQPKKNHIDDIVLTAAREHPSRILILATNPDQVEALNATIETGEDFPGEIITLRVGDLPDDQTRSILLPLLLPDSPVVAWWPFDAPDCLKHSVAGQLATRRIADAASAAEPFAALKARARKFHLGDADLAWTRLTYWRAMLAMTLDQAKARVTSAVVEAQAGNAPSHLLGSWLRIMLNIPVKLQVSAGPGLTGVRMHTDIGDISITRNDGVSATYVIPGQPDRTVALNRRKISDLIAEELRHMDEDKIYRKVCQAMIAWHDSKDLASG